MLPGGLVDRYELVAFLGIQFLMGYHRLPELSMYWERQPNTGYGLGIVHQAMTRERFKFISKLLACADHGELDKGKQLKVRKDPIYKIRSLVDVLNKLLAGECEVQSLHSYEKMLPILSTPYSQLSPSAVNVSFSVEICFSILFSIKQR
jgi:hypothetical protein